MAIAITVINSRGSPGDPISMPLTSRLTRRLWIGAFVAMLIAGVGSISFGLFSGYVLPGLFATVLGFAYFVQSMLSQRRTLQVAAIGWWVIAIPLFALRDERSLLGFGIALIFLQVVPYGFIWLKAKRAQQARKSS